VSQLDKLRNVDLKVYSATWCPECRRLDKWLSDFGLVYEKVDIESVEGASKKLERETGKRAIPYVLVKGEHWVRGYHKELPQRFDSDLFIQELLKAGLD